MISKPSSSGLLMPGTGALRLQQLTLPTLTSQQYELIIKAKKYASEETARVINSNKPLTTTTIVQPSTQNRLLQKQQALQLMSRVYVGSISFEVDEKILKNAFSQFGVVKSVNMSWDVVTMKHKGFAFIEFEQPEAAGLAIDRLNGIKFGSRQIKVGRPSNMPLATSMLEEIEQNIENENKIYISNIHPEFDDYDMITLMEPFGPIESCTVQLDEQQNRSYGYIQFKDKADANEALTADKLDLGGYILNICKSITIDLNDTNDVDTKTSNDKVQSVSSSDPVEMSLDSEDLRSNS